MDELLIRKIEPQDDKAVAEVIRSVMTEFDALGEGYSIEDAEMNAMHEAYQGERAIFYVVTLDSAIVGCGGIAPLLGGEEQTCELRKMYLLPEVRGRGAGRVLANLLINESRGFRFQRVYIETLASMEAANHLYQDLGFQQIDEKLGATGHFQCDRHYLLNVRRV